MFVNIIGLAYFFRMLLRMGLVQSAKAAPEGSLEASTQPVTVEEAQQAEAEQCPICLEDFGEDDGATGTGTASRGKVSVAILKVESSCNFSKSFS